MMISEKILRKTFTVKPAKRNLPSESLTVIDENCTAKLQ